MRILLLLLLGILIFGCTSRTSFEDCEKQCSAKNLPGEERYICEEGAGEWYCADTKAGEEPPKPPPVKEQVEQNFSYLPDYVPGAGGACSDTDGGLKPDTEGKIIMNDQPTAAEDYCVHGSLLREYLCSSDYSTYEYKEVKCKLPSDYDYAKYGGPCQEGRCKFGSE